MNEKHAYFTLSGENSLDHNLLIKADFTYPIAVKDVEHVQIPGRDRSMTIDNGNYKECSLVFPCYIEMDKKGFLKQNNHISRWLNKEQGWKELYFSDDPNYLYMVKNEELQGGRRGESYLGDIDIPFKAEAYKYLIDGKTEISIPKKMILVNPEEEAALPIVTILGKGDVTIILNNEKYELKGVNGSIVIDSMIENCSDSGGQATEKAMFKKYPVLKAGVNEISWTTKGTVSSILMMPNWRCLV